ncbi:MAG TPA: TVP38/TMEM64 family protein [Oscillatoriales cyanobacterium M4454_W2019_049]|nr:TVP38/TMEM64 family protein [Oscillatoriales cyanobacterium M4454_W2019_049]
MPLFSVNQSTISIALGLGAIACLWVSWHRLFDPDWFVAALHCWGNWAVGGFLVLYIGLTAVGIPGTVMTIAAGTVFGLVWGTVLSVIGATLGAIAAFWIARYGLRKPIAARFGKRAIFRNFQQAVRQQPWRFVFAVRFAPIAPFNLINFLFGLTPIHWLPYSLGTFVGIVPGTLAYVWLGVTGKSALSGGDRLSFVVALGAIALLSALPLWFGKTRREIDRSRHL